MKHFFLFLVFALLVLTGNKTCFAEEIRLYVRVPTASVDFQDGLAKFEPSFGSLLGATVDRDSKLMGNLSKAKEIYGRPYSALLIYVDWGESVPFHLMRQAKESKAVVQVAWQPSAGLDAVQEGEYLREFARALVEHGGPVLLRFGGEMNGSWTPWSGNPGLYKEKFRLVTEVMRAVAPNVAMVWSPNFVPDEHLMDYYPGDDYVDWVGINGYADYYFKGDPQYNDKSWVWKKFYQGHQADPLAKYRKIYNLFAEKKPIMISETGVAWLNRLNNQLVADWGANTLKHLYANLPLVYPRIKAVFYFNTSVPQDFSSYTVCDNELMFQAYREAIDTPYYLSRYDGESPFFYQPVANTAPSELCYLATYVDVGEKKVKAVEYYLDGKLVARAQKSPWEAYCRFPAEGEMHMLEIRAVGDKGSLLAKKSFQFHIPRQQPVTTEVDGKPVQSDVPPVIYYGRILLPVRSVSEALGASVEWDEKSRVVIIGRPGKEITLALDKKRAFVNGEEIVLPPEGFLVVGNRTLVQMRWLADTLGFEVNWNGSSRKVEIREKF